MDTTLADKTEVDHFSKYSALLESYEKDLADLQEKESMIPKQDSITSLDEEKAIKEFYEDDLLLEQQLGKRYLTTIDPYFRRDHEAEIHSGKDKRGRRGKGASMTSDAIVDSFEGRIN